MLIQIAQYYLLIPKNVESLNNFPPELALPAGGAAGQGATLFVPLKVSAMLSLELALQTGSLRPARCHGRQLCREDEWRA